MTRPLVRSVQMGRLVLKSQVFYMPGTWGASVPVPGATVAFVDVDAPGSDDDDIWSGTTGGDGRFRGTSAEWQDSETVPVVVWDSPFEWHLEDATVFDLTDALVLQVHIIEGPNDVWLPYVYFDEHVQTPALVVPWGPEGATLPFIEVPIGVAEPRVPGVLVASVNGQACMTPVQVNERVHAAIDAHAKVIDIDVHEPASVRIIRGTEAVVALTAWAGEQLGIPDRWRPDRQDWIDDAASGLSVGCAIVTTGVATSPLLVGIGVSILYAVNKRYVNVGISGSRKVRGFKTPSIRFTLTR